MLAAVVSTTPIQDGSRWTPPTPSGRCSRALRLSWTSIGFGAGRRLGLGRIGDRRAQPRGARGGPLRCWPDVTGSVVLVWRFRTERRSAQTRARAEHVELRAAARSRRRARCDRRRTGIRVDQRVDRGQPSRLEALTTIIAGGLDRCADAARLPQARHRHTSVEPRAARGQHAQRDRRDHGGAGVDRAAAVRRVWLVVGRPYWSRW